LGLFSTLELVSVGLVVGILVGLTGVGGGSIMTPMLVQVLGVNPLVAVGTDLLYSVPTRLYGAFLHRKQGTVNPQIVKALLLGGLPTSIAGLGALYWLRHHVDLKLVELWTKHAIGIALFLAAAMIIARPFFKRRELPVSQGPFAWAKGQRTRVVILGAVVGALGGPAGSVAGAEVGEAAAAAAFRFSRSAASGRVSLTLTGPMQRGLRYFAVAPLSASFLSRPGNSTRSCPGSRGVSPSNPESRSDT